ncbi:hypothetical protein HL653_08640 [Sphingomonas sp. AP4-R1]|uniref:DUF6683 family protein n=1 Tax=Sphingomonas sp. AP4-R1 TaxID=2735134 RepID=UPI0014938FB3|nr:DUF6683 family protein [Sphingomonas sp. AP4-R1]QJU57848.1 hypothetical protein HL653_08640 [Sphingomonas sp. AP4-R1]
MLRFRGVLRGCIVAIGLAGVSPVAAEVDGWGWSIIIPSVTRTDVLGTRLRQLDEEIEARDGATPKGGVVPAPVAPDPARLRYAPSRARRSANLAAFVAKSRQRDQDAARSLEQLFAQGDIIERMGTVLASYGMSIDNVADAYAVWWIDAWQASHRRNEDTDKRTFAAVRAQAARALSATRELAMADDAAKQRFAEALLLQALLLEGAMDQAKANPAMSGPVADAATRGARGMGLDIATMTLTPDGFIAAAR